MASLVLRIEIQQQKRVYFPGETISGILHVEPASNVTCRKLTINMNWRTGGRGNTDEGAKPQTITLYTGDFKAGLVEQFPFVFTVPNGPLTYHGNLLYVNWYLKAQADIAWAIDPTAQAEFVIGSPAEPVPLDLGPNYKPPKPPSQKEDMPWWGYVICAIILGVLVYFFSWCCLIIAVPLIVFWAIPAYIKYLQVKKLGNRVLEIDPQQAYGGDPIAVTFRYQAKKQIKVEYISATITGEEKVESGSGSTRQTHRNPLFNEEQFLVRDIVTAPGVPASHRAEIYLPAKAAPTFVSPNNAVEWKVNLNIKITNYGIWTETYSITVWPTPGQEQFVPEPDWDDDDDDEDDNNVKPILKH
ncbi:MAG: hypothetical protein ACAI35_14145 [Candidatus Methylacidiphilales bacterium]